MNRPGQNTRIPHPDHLDCSDVDARTLLPGWVRDPAPVRALFGAKGTARIEARRANREHRTVVYLSYENPWGKSGGVAAVATMFPRELMAASSPDQTETAENRESVLRISPFHRKLKTALDVSVLTPLATCPVEFGGDPVETAVYHVADKGSNDWYLIYAEPFFNADGGKDQDDPYVYSGEGQADRDGPKSKLLRDVLFAAKAVPEVLARLGQNQNLVLHAQDWEFAPVALTAKEAVLNSKLERASVVLTLHNPYDHSLPDEALAAITRRWQRKYWPPVQGDDRTTVLTRMIPLTDAPVSAVSCHFAQELRHAPLQTGHFAGHYQGILSRQGVVGIDNGLFDSPHIDSAYREAIEQFRSGSARPILALKRDKRHRMLEALQTYLKTGDVKARIFGDLDGGNGCPLTELPDQVPIFLMVGRLDPGQKGFDVFNRVIETAPKDFGRCILSPLSPLADDPIFKQQLADLKRVADSRPGEVVVIPFRLEAGIYRDIRAGVTWSVWPSLYEPFGGVTEFYLHGTPVIARATGGLVQQVISEDVDPLHASGILYLEAVPESFAWQEKMYHAMEATLDPVSRVKNLLYTRLVDALSQAIRRASDLYKDDATYARILANLPDMLDRLSWPRSVAEYHLWYDTACHLTAQR